MEKALLKKEVKKFINENLEVDVTKLLLKKSPFENIPITKIVQQIVGKRIARTKLPTFFKNDEIIYPPKLNLEQSSSEKTASFKAGLIDKCDTIIDITGGFGVDAFFLSKKCKNIIYNDLNKDIFKTVKHNYEKLGINNAVFKNEDGEKLLENIKNKVDVIFIDPSRRDKAKNKIFLLESCSPNIIKLNDTILKKCENCFIKLSPIVDIKSVKENVNGISEIYVIAVKNEVKELLIKINNQPTTEQTLIKAINITDEKNISFFFNLNQEKKCVAKLSEPKQYIYLPNHSILKAGAFKLVGDRFELNKLHSNTHLYTSNILINDFPGRVFKIEKEINNVNKEIKSNKVNIISRNYHLNTNQIKAKYKIKDGGSNYLIFTRSIKDKHVLLCKKLKPKRFRD